MAFPITERRSPSNGSKSVNRGGTPVNLGTGDEGFAGPFPIGFSFPFYSTTPPNFFVSGNGYISFDPNNQDYVNQCPFRIQTPPTTSSPSCGTI